MLTESSVLSFCVLPLLIFDFHIFQPLSILLTIIFGFLFDFMLLPLLLCCFLISFLGFSLNLNFIFQILEWLVHKVDLPLHYPFVLGKPSSLELIILFVLIGLFVDSFSHKKRRFFLIGFIFLFFFITKNPMRASITAVDIGQGDSIFLQDKFNKENILIDTGGQLALPQKNWQKAQTQSNADKTLIPYLESMGVASY